MLLLKLLLSKHMIRLNAGVTLRVCVREIMTDFSDGENIARFIEV